MNRTSGTGGIITKDLTLVSVESQREKKKENGAKMVFKEIL